MVSLLVNPLFVHTNTFNEASAGGQTMKEIDEGAFVLGVSESTIYMLDWIRYILWA